jgi:hypothetical protein
MIFGEYPCCEGPLAIAIPDKCPAFVQEECPHCGAKVWHRLSRIDPESYTEDEFFKVYKVDFDKKSIERLDGKPV